MSDARIVLTIDYEPILKDYPSGTETKADAMRQDVEAAVDGTFSAFDLIDFADDICYEVVEQ